MTTVRFSGDGGQSRGRSGRIRVVTSTLIAVVLAIGVAIGTGAMTAGTGSEALVVVASAFGAGGTTLITTVATLRELMARVPEVPKQSEADSD